MKHLAALGSGLLLLATGTAYAASGPAVVELFTSQSCYSCPPAERYLGELSERKHLVVLEYHVDYWNDLVYGSAGKWKDPFSSEAFTRRQVRYNERIRGRSGVYTPQMVIDGRHEVVGSRRNDVERVLDAKTGTMTVTVDIMRNSSTGTMVRLSGGNGPAAKIWLVRFIRKVVTRVRAGENKGETLVNHHVVTDLRPVGEWAGRSMTLNLDDLKLETGESCAILVQEVTQGPVLGASLCPEPLS